MSKKNIWIVTAALLLSNAMIGLDATIINTALPAIISDLHGIQLMGWIVAVFLLGTAVSTAIWSKLGERIGNKKAYQIATLTFGIGAFLEGMSPSIWFLIGARLVMGIGAGGMNALPFIIYADLYDNIKQRAKILGIATASYSTASIIGPLVGGWIVDTFSWHWVFYINVPLALISIIVIGIYFKDVLHAHDNVPFDYLGALLLICGLVSLLMTFELMGTTAVVGMVALLVLAIVLLWLLFRNESRSTDPIIPIRLFKNRELVIDLLLFILIWGAFIAFNVYIPMWAQGILGTSAVIGGVTQIPSSITNFMGSESTSYLNGRVRQMTLVIVGIVALLVAFIIMILGPTTMSYVGLLVASAFVGVGVGMCFTVLQIKVQTDAESRDVPIATSFSYLVRMLSQTFTSSIFGVVLNRALANGVGSSHGRISMAMMNELSDASTSANLPKQLLPEMRTILHTGLHNIMLIAVVILIVALVLAGVNLWRTRAAAAAVRVE